MRAPSETPKFIRRSPISDSLSKYSGFAVAQFVDSVVEAANKAGISARVLSRAKHQAGTLFDPIFFVDSVVQRVYYVLTKKSDTN